MEYADLRPVIDVWETKCDSLVVVQHPPEGKTKRIHCHILMETKSGENWFRDAAKAALGEFIKRGNYWIATRVQKGDYAGKLIERKLCLVYMIKGKFSVSFSKNFSQQEVEEARLAWVDSVKSDQPGDHSEKMIKEVMSHFTVSDMKGYYHEDESIVFGQPRYNIELLFDNVRSVAWRKLWGEHRKAPQPWVYKSIASTAYLRICEDYKCFEAGSAIVRDRWY